MKPSKDNIWIHWPNKDDLLKILISVGVELGLAKPQLVLTVSQGQSNPD